MSILSRKLFLSAQCAPDLTSPFPEADSGSRLRSQVPIFPTVQAIPRSVEDPLLPALYPFLLSLWLALPALAGRPNAPGSGPLGFLPPLGPVVAHPDSGWVALSRNGNEILHFTRSGWLRRSGGSGTREQGLLEALDLQGLQGLHTLVLDLGNRRMVYYDRGLRVLFREQLPSVFDAWTEEDLEECEQPRFLLANRAGTLLLLAPDPPCILLRDGPGRPWRRLLRGSLGLALEELDDCLLTGLDLWLMESREGGALLQGISLEGAPRKASFHSGLQALVADPDHDRLLLLKRSETHLLLEQDGKLLRRCLLPAGLGAVRSASLGAGGLLAVDEAGQAWWLAFDPAGGRP